MTKLEKYILIFFLCMGIFILKKNTLPRDRMEKMCVLYSKRSRDQYHCTKYVYKIILGEGGSRNIFIRGRIATEGF